MGTKIEWCAETWNPVTGCTPISDGCKNCYAKAMTARFGDVWRRKNGRDFSKVEFHPDKLEQPLRWEKPRVVFVCSMGDLFHDDVKDEWIISVLKIINTSCSHRLWPDAPNYYHKFLILTKRPERMADIFNKLYFSSSIGLNLEYCGVPYCTPGRSPMSNLWLGVTAENQEMADLRIPTLLQIPAAVHFVSVEPMLGPVDLVDSGFLGCTCENDEQCYGTCDCYKKYNAKRLNWIICGGETGPGKRPMKTEWAIDLRDQCRAAGVPFFFKKDSTGSRLLDGKMYEEYPEVIE